MATLPSSFIAAFLPSFNADGDYGASANARAERAPDPE
jgi:hypothetical protein